jgi:hypothetical protein
MVEEKEGAAEEEEVVAGGGGGRRRGRWPPTGVLALAAEQRRCSLPQGPSVRAYCWRRVRVPAMWMEWEAARVGIGSGGVEVGWLILFVGPAGPLGLVPAHGPRRAYNFRAVLGRHYGLRLQPSPVQRRARAGPGPITSCWVRARVGPKSRALGRPMGLVLFGHL